MIINYNWQSPRMRNLDTEPATEILLRYLKLYKSRLNSDFLFRLGLEILIQEDIREIYLYQFADKKYMLEYWDGGEGDHSAPDQSIIRHCEAGLKGTKLLGIYPLAKMEVCPWGPNDFYNIIFRPTEEAIHFLNKLPRKYHLILAHPELLAEIEYAKRKIADGKTTLSNK